jgi:UDP-N-acetylglucosamine acyltransferase
MAIDPTAEVHATAVIDDGAEIGPGCRVGPYCVIGPEVALGPGVVLHSHVAVAGRTRIGEATAVLPFASLGHIPQDLKFRGEPVELVIGARNSIREHVTMNPGTGGGGGITRVGDDNLFMMATHVAHDCLIGSNVIMANNATLGGHVVIDDFAVLGGLCAIHQHVRIGRGAMIGGLAGVVADVIPYGSVLGERAHLAGLNLVGLKRRGASRDDINGLRAAFGEMFEGEGSLQERVRRVGEKHAGNPLVREVVDFVTSESARSFTVPAD